MYALGMIALLGMAVLVVTRIASRYVLHLTEVRALTFAVLGIAAAWLINLNLFTMWAIPVRDTGIAVTVTGLVLAGTAGFWWVLTDFATGVARKITDQAEVLERREHLRRAA